MKRDFNVPKGEHGLEPGDEIALQKATALAQLADAPTIEKLLEAVTMLDLFGGQIYIQAVRAKFTAAGEVIPDSEARETPGRWETIGYVFRFDTVDAAVMENKDNAFVVKGPIAPAAGDDRELGRKEALGQVAETPVETPPPSPSANGSAPEPAAAEG